VRPERQADSGRIEVAVGVDEPGEGDPAGAVDDLSTRSRISDGKPTRNRGYSALAADHVEWWVTERCCPRPDAGQNQGVRHAVTSFDWGVISIPTKPL
jgi:hypothetical protein